MTTEKNIKDRVVVSLRGALNELYRFITPGQPIEYNTVKFTERTGLTIGLADDRCQTLQDLGILSRTVHYGRRTPDGKYNLGRWAEWNLHMPYEEAKRRVEDWIVRYYAGEVFSERITQGKHKGGSDRGGRPKKAPAPAPTRVMMKPSSDNDAEDADILAEMGIKPKTKQGAFVDEHLSMDRVRAMKPFEDQAVADAALDEAEKKEGAHTVKPSAIEKVALATKPDEEVRAIVGPDRPSPFAGLAALRKNEAAALVEAARQYANRTDRMKEQITKLVATAKELGITINPDMLAGGIEFEEDERLATIGLVLPYINGLETQVGRLADQIEEMRRKGDVEDLRNQNRRLKERVERLVSERVTAAQQAAAQN